MVVDEICNWRKYSHLPLMSRAFELLSSPEARMWPDGKVELDGKRLIAMPQGYITRSEAQGKWEAHRRYIDIQFMLSGAERMGYAPVGSLSPGVAYDETKDVGFYTGTGDFITVREGMFAIFYPQDAHMPCLQVGGEGKQVRKIVMKVAVE